MAKRKLTQEEIHLAIEQEDAMEPSGLHVRYPNGHWHTVNIPILLFPDDFITRLGDL
jgi:hypothetical protein